MAYSWATHIILVGQQLDLALFFRLGQQQMAKVGFPTVAQLFIFFPKDVLKTSFLRRLKEGALKNFKRRRKHVFFRSGLGKKNIVVRRIEPKLSAYEATAVRTYPTHFLVNTSNF